MPTARGGSRYSKKNQSTTARRVVFGKTGGGGRICADPRCLSTGTVVIGAPGSGKTNFLDVVARQLLHIHRGAVGIIDGMGGLYGRLVPFYASRFRMGRLPVPVLLNPGSEWVTGFNPLRKDGDLFAQIDSVIGVILRAWGADSSDEMPRLEKWLRVIIGTLIENNLTIAEALLVITDAGFRKKLERGTDNPIIRAKLAELSEYSNRDFLAQTESTENRLFRFTAYDPVGLSMGLGENVIDPPALMESKGVLFANLGESAGFSKQQRVMYGSMLIKKFYEAAMQRKKGARPFYLIIDEAAMFAIPELGDALEHCRQKGLHLIIAFQNLGQFRKANAGVLSSIMNSARTKIIFRVEEFEDALYISDNIFRDLAEANIKRHDVHLNHLLLDTPMVSVGFDESEGKSTSTGRKGSSGWVTGTTVNRGLLTSGGKDSLSEGETEVDHNTGAEGWEEGETDSVTRGRRTTMSLGTRHIPFPEFTPVEYSFEEKRRKSAEQLMALGRGECFVKLPEGQAEGVSVPPTPGILLSREDFLQLRQEFHEKCSSPKEDAQQIILERQRALLEKTSKRRIATDVQPSKTNDAPDSRPPKNPFSRT